MTSKFRILCTAVGLACGAAAGAQRGPAAPVTAGPRASVPVPQGATVVNAAGKTIIPGLIDVHCHLNQPADVMRRLLPVTLNWGITTIRMVGNDKPEIMHVYAEARAGKFPSPRVYSAEQGFNLSGPYPGAPTLKPASPEEARAGVRAHKDQKVDFIKIWMGDKGFTPEVVATRRACSSGRKTRRMDRFAPDKLRIWSC